MSITERAGQTHSTRALPMAQELLSQRRLVASDCDGVAFGAGPGSFTGLRIACGLAQGLGMACAVPVFAVDSLLARAWSVWSNAARWGGLDGAATRAAGNAGARPGKLQAAAAGGFPVAVLIDARMGEVYAALYEFGAGADDRGWPRTVIAPFVATGSAALERLSATGGGSTLILVEESLLAGGLPGIDAFRSTAGCRLAHAEAVAELAAICFADGDRPDAGVVSPLYVRDRVALNVEEQALARAARFAGPAIAQPPPAGDATVTPVATR